MEEDWNVREVQQMKRTKKILLYVLMGFLLVIFSLLLLLTGERQAVKRKSISVIVDNSTSNRWTALKEGMEAAAKDYNLRLNYVSTVKLWSVTAELEMAAREMESGADGLILQMYASEGIGEKLEEIVPRDQCVLLETDITPEEYYQTVGPDNRKLGGVLAGQIRADYGESLQGKRVGIFCGNTGELSIRQRIQGLKEGLEDSEIQVVWELHEMGRTPDEAAENDCWETGADIVISLENDMTERVVDYLAENQDMLNQCKLYGIGNSEKVMYYLDRGFIRKLVVPNDFYMGYQSVEELAKKLEYRGESHKNIYTGYLVIDRTNLYDETNQKMLFPIVQ